MINEDSIKMLEELRDSHDWCCIKIQSDYNYVWDISLIRSSGKDLEHETSVRSGSFEDLNEAVKNVYKNAMEYLSNEQNEEQES